MPRRRPADHPYQALFARCRPLQAPPTRFRAPSALAGSCRACVRRLPARRTFPLRRFENRPCGFSLRWAAGRFFQPGTSRLDAFHPPLSVRVIRSRLILDGLRSRPAHETGRMAWSGVAQRERPRPGSARRAWRFESIRAGNRVPGPDGAPGVFTLRSVDPAWRLRRVSGRSTHLPFFADRSRSFFIGRPAFASVAVLKEGRPRTSAAASGFQPPGDRDVTICY